jgi:hypothetical protein
MPESHRRPLAVFAACAALAALAVLPGQARAATAIEGTTVDASSATRSAVAAGSATSARAFRAIRRVNRPWVCSRRVNLDLVKITMRTANSHAIYLRPGCTGRIDRIEVRTWTADGITVNRGNGRQPAHDLVIGDGYIRCHAHSGGHQDGIQVMDGRRLTFRSLRIKCGDPDERGTNSQFYVSGNHPFVPRRVLCVRCILGTGAASPLFIDLSVDSGARNTTVCRGDFGYAVRVERAVAVRPVRENLRILGRNHRLC